MSSAITTAFNAMLARVGAVLLSTDGWAQIPNAYDIESNASGFLRQGYGIAVGPGVNTKRQLCNTLCVDRTFTLSIAREVFKTDGDADGYDSVMLQLYEDLKLVIADFETNTTLNTGQIIAGYESDTGIKPLSGENFSGMYLSAEFKVQMFENLS